MLYKEDSIEEKYPESYNESQTAVGDMIADFLNTYGVKYTAKEKEAIVKFMYDLAGIRLECDWGGVEGWFIATSDMAYDEYARLYVEEQ